MLGCFICGLKTVCFGCRSILCMLASDHVDMIVTFMLNYFSSRMTVPILFSLACSLANLTHLGIFEIQLGKYVHPVLTCINI